MTLGWGFRNADEVRQQNAKAMEGISTGVNPADYGRLASQLKGQLHRLFKKPYNPDLLPPWPHRESRVARAGISLALKKHLAQSAHREIVERRPCRYHPWLRTKESRPLVLAAWLGELKRAKPDSTATNRTANHLLRQIFELWCVPAIVKTIVQRAKAQHASISRQRAAADLFGDRVVR